MQKGVEKQALCAAGQTTACLWGFLAVVNTKTMEGKALYNVQIQQRLGRAVPGIIHRNFVLCNLFTWMQNERSQTLFKWVHVRFLYVVCTYRHCLYIVTQDQISFPKEWGVFLSCFWILGWNLSIPIDYFFFSLPAVLLGWSSWQLQAPSRVTVLFKGVLFIHSSWSRVFWGSVFTVPILCKRPFLACLQRNLYLVVLSSTVVGIV